MKVVVESGQYLTLPEPEHWLSDWSTQNSVIVHQLNEPDNLHPANGSSQVRSEIFLYIHSALLRTDLRTGTVQPGICKSLPQISKNKLELVFELKEGLNWDDGSPLSPEDVVFTIKAAKCPLTDNAAFKPYFDLVENAEVVAGAENKVRVKMKKVYVQNVALWADYPIIQRAKYDPLNSLASYTFEQFNDTAFNAASEKSLVDWAASFNAPENGFSPASISGLGPYRLKEWQQGQMLVLERKQKHWTKNSDLYADAAGPDQIVFKINKDPLSQELAFYKQEFDASTSLSSRTLLKLRGDSTFNRNYHGRFVDVFGYTFIALNTKPGVNKRAMALAELNVRKALALLTPVDKMIEVVNKGVNKRVNGPVAPMKPSYNKSLPVIPFDIKKANALLDESGWLKRDKDGIRMKQLNGMNSRLELELLYLNLVPEWKEMALMLASAMGKAGVQVKLAPCDLSLWLERGTGHDFDMMMGSWNNSALPEDYTQLWSSRSWSDNGLNFAGFGDERSDALIDSIAITLDDSLRNEMEWRMQEQIYAQQPYIFLYGLVRRTAIHRRFSGVELYAERPGVLYNTFRLTHTGAGVKAGTMP
ncbi:MAG: hypothetical protein JNL88_00320 [Bacteroidia bacterium]|nr:hypothetical protein [Bacteroidia bacterium]